MTQQMKGKAQVYLEWRMEQPEMHNLAGGQAAVFTAPAPYRDTPNEDAAALIPINDHSAVFIVADGVGGMQQGGTASRIVIQAIEAALAEAVGAGTDLQPAILGGIEQADQAIRSLGADAATTLAVAELNGNEVRPYHVGDSPILVFGQRGKMKLQTVCHSPVGFALEAGMLDEKEAMYHEERHLVSNVIGAAETRIEIGMPFKMDARDTLLLASDGLMDNLHVEEVVNRLRNGPVEKAARSLVSKSHERMTRPVEGKPSKPDDITFIAFRKTR
jgi:serine/threonine protein phosphatase PrpC